MRYACLVRRSLWLSTVFVALCAAAWPEGSSAQESRRSAIVKAIERAKDAVVDIRGEKVLGGEAAVGPVDSRRVNGMGTGVIIDPRGYILTNFHVVDGVEALQARTDNGRTYAARVLATDAAEDLAIIKIEAGDKLPVIPIGTARDLMLGETVIAVGNPFGYDHTVTRGIVSALHRTVPVTPTQTYEDLIQTDASINPGNSGGPLLNIEGDVVGLTVAVRAGAQGIGFAIPIDRAMTVAAELLSRADSRRVFHGMLADDADAPCGMRIKEVSKDSPAARVGLRPGDMIVGAGGMQISRWLDFERTLLGRKPGDEIDLVVQRGDEQLERKLVLAKVPVHAEDEIWTVLGLRLRPVPASSLRHARAKYRGGLQVTEVRGGGPADRQGIKRGDVLLGMHVWETISLDNVRYVLSREDLAALEPVKFYILRGNETLYGHMRVSGHE